LATAEATPACAPGMAATAAATAGALASPNPEPSMASFHHSAPYGVATWMPVSSSSAVAPSSRPATTGTR
jgi:hypothetical protein